MSELTYVSKVRIERLRGPLRLAYIPGEPEAVRFGVHGAIAQHYGVSPTEFPSNATTIDYLVAAAAG